MLCNFAYGGSGGVIALGRQVSDVERVAVTDGVVPCRAVGCVWDRVGALQAKPRSDGIKVARRDHRTR